MHVPVICDNCGAVFGAGGIELGPGARNITIENFQMGPCPVCMKTGHAVDGVYDAFGDGLRILWDTNEANLRRLEGMLRTFQQDPPTASEVADAIDSEVPGLSAQFEWLKGAKTSQAVAVWISVLLQLIALILMWTSSGQSQDVINKNINETTINVIEKASPPPDDRPSAPKSP